MTENSLSPEIIKLMDKITKDPTSRYFVPLAEEYIKCDMLDEAVLVLMEGIKSNPNYLAGRVLLGKVYLQKKQIPEAKVEFESVIQINPENIVAHKKLAQIYKGEGQFDKAIETCKRVLLIDPTDKEIKGVLGTLERENAPVLVLEVPARESHPEKAPPVTESESFPALAEEELSKPVSEIVTPPAPASEEEIAPFDPPMEPEVFTPLDEAPTLLTSDASGVVEASSPSFSEPLPEVDILEADLGFNPSEVEEGEKTRMDVAPSSEAFTAEWLPLPPSVLEEEKKEKEKEEIRVPEGELLSPTLASLYISQGHYEKAIEVYKKLLEITPEDEEFQEGLRSATEKLRAARPEDTTGSGSERKKKLPTGKTQRLQSWLDSIREDEQK